MNILQNTILNLDEKLRGKIVKFSKKKNSHQEQMNSKHSTYKRNSENTLFSILGPLNWV